jgi:hypothetical protein
MPDTFVLDCSVAAKGVLPEPDRAQALGWFEVVCVGRSDADRSGPSPGGIRQSDREAKPPKTDFGPGSSSGLRSHDDMLAATLRHELSLQFQLSLWDCVYLALGLEHDCPVLTRMKGSFGQGRADTWPTPLYSAGAITKALWRSPGTFSSVIGGTMLIVRDRC